MGFNNIHNTNLVLGLGLGFSSTPDQTPPVKLDDQHGKRSGPSLTLTLSADHVYNNLQPQDSTCASISVCNGKGLKGVGVEEVERERIASPRACDEDDGASNGRKKLRLTKAQSTLLEESFKQHSTLNTKHKKELAKELKLRPRQVEVWFQNRRARTKLKQTEVDCKHLKKCYDTLTEENRRLQKELQQLKSQNFAPPLYKQFPAATVTMCPSCERIGGGATTTSATVVVGDNGSKRLLLSMAPHVLTNPSAQLAS